MYVETVPNRDSPPAILLRESYREGGKVKKRTLLNLSDWPRERVEGLRALLKGGTVVRRRAGARSSILRTLPHGHVAAVLGTLARDRPRPRCSDRPATGRRDLVMAMIVSRLIAPASKLATARALDPTTADLQPRRGSWARGASTRTSSTSALDWLAERQPAIETALARNATSPTARWCSTTSSSSYLEGRCCPLAKLGYNRDGKKGKLQIVYGLLVRRRRLPGGDRSVRRQHRRSRRPSPAQIDKLKERFGSRRMSCWSATAA